MLVYSDLLGEFSDFFSDIVSDVVSEFVSDLILGPAKSICSRKGES